MFDWSGVGSAEVGASAGEEDAGEEAEPPRDPAQDGRWRGRGGDGRADRQRARCADAPLPARAGAVGVGADARRAARFAARPLRRARDGGADRVRKAPRHEGKGDRGPVHLGPTRRGVEQLPGEVGR